MPKPKPNQITAFRQFQKRQQTYEKRYQKHLLKYLSATYYQAAKMVAVNGTRINLAEISNNSQLEKVLTSLYKTVTLKEAKIAHDETVMPLEGVKIQKKDLIDDLLGMLSPSNRGVVNIWRSLLDNFIQVRLTNRITRINQYTAERIAKIIEEGMFEGLGQEEVARMIRREARGNINVNRSRNIARTETVVASNQGKYMSANSSNLVMKKKWIPASDARTRRSHKDMLGRDWIPLNDDFAILNTELGTLEPALYPGDERLSAGNVINCRCAIVFEPIRDMNGNLVRKR